MILLLFQIIYVRGVYKNMNYAIEVSMKRHLSWDNEYLGMILCLPERYAK